MPELFPKPPEQRNKQISVSAVNQLLRAVPRVITGDGVQMKRLGDRYVVEHREELNQPAPQIQHFVVMEEQDDYLTCVQFNFSDIAQDYDPLLGISLQELGLTGVETYVAKPYWLQQTPFHNESIILNGVSGILAYTGTGTRTFTPTAEDPISQTLTPSYFAGDIIAAYEAPTGISVDSQLIVWTDLNTAGRNWVSESTGGLSSIIVYTNGTFTVPSNGSTVSVTVDTVSTAIWMVINGTVIVTDGSHIIQGTITAIADATHFTLRTENILGGSAGQTMADNAKVIMSTAIRDATTGNRGVVSVGTQGFSGAKTFTGDVTVQGTLLVDTSGGGPSGAGGGIAFGGTSGDGAAGIGTNNVGYLGMTNLLVSSIRGFANATADAYLVPGNYYELWNAATAYSSGVPDRVSLGGVGYQCNTSHTNQMPPNASYWTPLASPWYTSGSVTHTTLRLLGLATDDNIYDDKPSFAIQINTTLHTGAWGTSAGGDTVKGGLITTLGAAITAASLGIFGSNTGDQDASTTPYTPTTTGDWNGADPTTVLQALDRCAALLKTLNGGTGP